MNWKSVLNIATNGLPWLTKHFLIYRYTYTHTHHKREEEKEEGGEANASDKGPLMFKNLRCEPLRCHI